jgi:hypothetical protein
MSSDFGKKIEIIFTGDLKSIVLILGPRVDPRADRNLSNDGPPDGPLSGATAAGARAGL